MKTLERKMVSASKGERPVTDPDPFLRVCYLFDFIVQAFRTVG
jgi:hypothetical protein